MSYPDCDCEVCTGIPPDQYRTFEELNLGDKFICPLSPGDNSGHGGLKGAPYLFSKVGERTAIRVKDGIQSDCPPTMYVVQVIL